MFGIRYTKMTAAPIQNSDINTVDRLAGKVKFLQISQSDLERVTQLESLLAEHVDVITERHYQMLGEFSNLLAIVDNHSTLERLADSFRRYLHSISNARLDEAYLAGREKIGAIHSKIGLAPEWYTGSYLRVYECMIPAIVAKHAKQPQELSASLLALIKVLTLDSQIVLEAYQEGNDFKVIDRLGNVLELVMQINKIKHVKDTAATTTDEANTVRIAGEQLTASVQNVAQSAAQVAEDANITMQQASTGKKIIQSSLNDFFGMADEFSEMTSKITHLQSAIDNISQVVQVIRNVADQTNLLALNASIEAARAGEHGRGFAVVAEEVRKLAEQTRQSVQTITATIEHVQSEAHGVSKSATQMAEHFHERTEQTREASELMEDIVLHIDKVRHSTGHIAAITQEQSAATSDISSRLAQVQTNMEQITEHISEAGQNVYDIGAAVNDMHKISINQISQLKTKHYLRIVKTDHLLWKWWLYNFMLGYHQIEERDLVDHHQCRLGKWYDEAKNHPHIRSLPSFQKLEEHHRRFHETVRTVYELVSRGKQKEAADAFRSLEDISEVVLTNLDQLSLELT